jgi:hypothetical protein
MGRIVASLADHPAGTVREPTAVYGEAARKRPGPTDAGGYTAHLSTTSGSRMASRPRKSVWRAASRKASTNLACAIPSAAGPFLSGAFAHPASTRGSVSRNELPLPTRLRSSSSVPPGRSARARAM